MRPSKFTSSLCTGEGGVFGGMYFYHSMFNFMPMPNAASGSSFYPWRNRPCRNRRHSGAALGTVRSLEKERPAAGGAAHRRVRVEVRGVALLVCFARSLRCIVCLPGLPPLCLLWVVSALAGFIHHLVKGTLFWFVCCASRGHRFALGTGGLKQSLLVGGIGPVYSLPKYCFKPFRSEELHVLSPPLTNGTLSACARQH